MPGFCARFGRMDAHLGLAEPWLAAALGLRREAPMVKPVRIFIDQQSGLPLPMERVKYTFRTLLTIAGLPVHFLARQENPDIYYGPKPADALLRIVPSRVTIQDATLPASFCREGLPLLDFESSTPPPPPTRDGARTTLGADMIMAAYYLLTGGSERFIQRDGKDNHDVRQSWLYQNNLLHVPLVDLYAGYIKGLFTSYNPIPPWPGGRTHAFAASHDVDYPEMVRPIEALRYLMQNKAASSPGVLADIAAGRNSFWQFEEWLALETQLKARAAFYFCGKPGTLLDYFLTAPDPFYDVSAPHFKDAMKKIQDQGGEVGLHAGYLCYKTPGALEREKAAVEAAAGGPISGNRHHYWHMDPEGPFRTARMHAAAGLRYDCSICFERRPGFRYSVASPFHLYDPENEKPVPVLQIPSTLMDDQLFGYKGLTRFASVDEEVEELIRQVKSSGGVMMLDYHQRVLNKTFFDGWGESFQRIARAMMEDSATFHDTPANIAAHWLEREAELEKLSLDETGLKAK